MPAGAILDTMELSSHPQLRARGLFQTFKDPTQGEFEMVGCPIQLSDSTVPLRPAPTLGEHSEEIYTALSTGVIDAAHWGAAAGALTMKLCEPAKYYIQPNLAFSATDLIMVSKKAWDELPADLQKIVYLVFKERCWRRSNEYIQEEVKALETMKKKYGVQVSWLDKEAQKVLQQAAIKIWDETAALSSTNAEWIGKMKEFLKELGYID